MDYFIACDIDHTLLNDKGELLPANVAALNMARDFGATVILATARSFAGAAPIHKQLELETPLVISNGTLVCEPDGNVLMAQTIDATTAKTVVELFRETPHHWSFRTSASAFIHPQFDTSRPPFSDERHYRKTDHYRLGDELGDYSTLITASLFGVPLRSFYYEHDWLKLDLTADYYPPSHYNSLEAMSVMSTQASKGSAVRWLRDYLGLGKAPTLCIGDSVADASMFNLGVGVAPENASIEVRAQADWVAPHCDHGAVAATLERYLFAEVRGEGLRVRGKTLSFNL